MTTLKKASPERHVKLLYNAARVGKAVTSILDPDELLRWSVDIICDEFDFYYAGVFLLDETGKWAVLRAGRGEAGAEMVAKGHKLAVGGHSMVGMATRLREARIAKDVGQEIEFASNPYLPGTRSEIALPLVAGDDVIGALTVQSTDLDAFRQEDISTLQSMADQLAIAIVNSRLHRQNQELIRKTERRARLFKAANRVGKRVASILDLDELLPQTVDIICEAYGFYYAGVFLIDETGEWAVLRAGHGEAGEAMLAEKHKLAVGGHSMIGLATSLREARIALDVGEERVHFKNPHLPHTRSEMALPLVAGDKVLGAVTVQSTEGGAFSENDILTLQTMVDHLAVAINNAIILKELERANQELLRTKTYEALATATTQAVHWIGNKALPITTTAVRIEAALDDDPLDKESLIEDLGMIAESADLIVAVKENLIGPAREQQPRPAILSDVVRAAAFHTGVPDEKLILKVAEGAPMALADTTQLVRALGNLFRNALEASAENIEVLISSAAEPGFVLLEITDNGEGMPPEVLDKVWAAFYTTKGPDHSGLGLPACLHVVGQLDGRISVTSELGLGTTFHILLPVSPERNTEEQVLSGESRPILLIADEDRWSEHAINVLSSSGYLVTRRTDLDKRVKTDLVLLDEMLWVGDFETVVDQLKDAGMIDRTIVLATALNVERTAAHIQAGVQDVVLKPYTPDDFAMILSG